MQVNRSPLAQPWIRSVFSCGARRYARWGLRKTSAGEALLAGLFLDCQGCQRCSSRAPGIPPTDPATDRVRKLKEYNAKCRQMHMLLSPHPKAFLVLKKILLKNYIINK